VRRWKIERWGDRKMGKSGDKETFQSSGCGVRMRNGKSIITKHLNLGDQNVKRGVRTRSFE